MSEAEGFYRCHDCGHKEPVTLKLDDVVPCADCGSNEVFYWERTEQGSIWRTTVWMAFWIGLAALMLYGLMGMKERWNAPMPPEIIGEPVEVIE